MLPGHSESPGQRKSTVAKSLANEDGEKAMKKSIKVSSGESHRFIFKIGECPQIILYKPPMVGSYSILSAYPI